MNLSPPIPVLRIFDEDRAREFYLGFLGFSVDWENRLGAGSPLYMQISRDGCVLHLTGHHGDCCPGSAIRVETQGVSELCEVLRAKAYKHSHPHCEATPWNTLEMAIADPFGSKIHFYETVKAEE